MNRLAVLSEALSDDTSQSNGAFRGLIYGGSGSGKSYLSMKVLDEIVAPNKTLLWIDTSDNYLIAPQIGIKHRWKRIPFTFVEDIRLMAEAIRDNLDGWGEVGGICFDEASMASQADIDRLHEHRVKNWNPSDHKGKEAPLSPDWDDSRPAFNRWRNLLRDLLDIPGLHVIFTAHEFYPGGESKETRVRADFPPATYKETKAKVAMVGRLEADAIKAGKDISDIVRTIQVHQTGGVDAKNRMGIPDIRFDSQYLPEGVSGWLTTPTEVAQDVIDDLAEITPIN